MAFLKGLFKKLKTSDETKKKNSLEKVRRDINPEEIWEVVDELGDGAYGKVYKAKQKRGETLSALKKVEFDSEIALEDFMVEIDILTEFKHPNIISLLEVYIYDSKLWMFLELCSGGALDSIMNSLEKPLTEPQIRFVAREVLSGLKFLHENLIIHRDMKAGNILLTSANEVKLADFGVSAFLTNERQKRDTFIGSPYWMAPEVIACETLKESPYNWKADMWSFGITLIELAQMRPPHNDINPTRVLLKITKSDPPTLLKPKFWSAAFCNLLTRCLQKDPSKRPECSELLMDPFVANLSEADRSCIKLLLCELGADVVETVEETDSVELGEEEIEEDVLILPDSTKLEIPMEVLDEEEEEENVDAETKPESELSDDARAADEFADFDHVVEEQPSNGALHKPDEAAIKDLARELTDQLVGEVVSSETRHPSVPSCLFEVMKELSEGVVVSDAQPKEPCTSPKSSISSPPMSVSKLSRRASSHKSLTRTRRFIVDGKVVTTTTKHIVPVSAEKRKQREEDLNLRKAELRAFRMLGKQEARQTRELSIKAAQQKELLESKLAAEFLGLKRGYEQKLEAISRNYRAQLERLEKEYETESKRIRTNTTKEEQLFKEQLRKELDKYSRAERKLAVRELNADAPILSKNSLSSAASLTSLNSIRSNSSQKSVISDRLVNFREDQTARFSTQIKQLVSTFQQRLRNLREEELVEKHTLRVSFEQDKCKMEKRHMQMRHQLARCKLQDFFSIKRQKLAGLLDLELGELKQTIAKEREKLNTIHAIERKNFAKYIKNTQKKNMSEFQRQNRPDTGSVSRLKERLRDNRHHHISSRKLKSTSMILQAPFTSGETRSKRASIMPFVEASRHQVAEYNEDFEKRLRHQQDLLEHNVMFRFEELDKSHAEKRNDLADLETERLRELDEKYQAELKSYVESFSHTQALLRTQFQNELDQISSQSSSLLDPSLLKTRLQPFSRHSLSSAGSSSYFTASNFGSADSAPTSYHQMKK